MTPNRSGSNITPTIQMDLDQEIKFINQKDMHVILEERHQLKIPELPPVPKGWPEPFKLLSRVQKPTELLLLFSDLNHFQQAKIEIYQSQYKDWFIAAKQQDLKILPSVWIGTMNSHLQVKKFMGPEKTEDLQRGCTCMSCKGQVQQIEACSKNQKCFERNRRRCWTKERTTAKWKILRPHKQ
ncbi:hypothetical protein O181_022928 [Austropuccinia psidii MF-1]|uniref:Uncharacterized protein n=1 Tax=Austropuccinia psidii MF-1 TaxID=1389203 RepID=A0A9Q3CG47_9BASI|nr:hypothetical protein [Austropuccinia psidii MF-1]